MKKFLIPLLGAIILMTASCTDDTEGTTEPETHPPVEITTAQPIPLTEMSPDTTDVTLPDGISVRVLDIGLDSFEEIDPKDSYFGNSGHDKVLDSGDAQYFFVNDDIKIHVLFFEKTEDGKRGVTASASYNTETGFLEFFGNENKTWYYDEEGRLRCVVYTYSFGPGTPSIYTFYTPEGQKEVTRTMDGWYSADYDILTNEEIAECLTKYAGVSEATAEYKSSDITNK